MTKKQRLARFACVLTVVVLGMSAAAAATNAGAPAKAKKVTRAATRSQTPATPVTTQAAPDEARESWWDTAGRSLATGQPAPVTAATEQDDQVTMCHCPPGNHTSCVTITVGGNAATAHENHGDQKGVCPEGSPSEP